MPEGKYYWLKLDKDFFKRHDIRIVEDMPNGEKYINFYLKMLLESLNHDGYLRFNEQIPYSEQMLATITNTDPDTTRMAIKVFSELQMIEIMDDGTFYMSQVNKMIGSESKWAEKKRIYRDKTKSVNESTRLIEGPKEDNVLALSGQCPTEIDIEKEIEIDKEIDIYSARTRVRLGVYGNVLLTKDELEELIRQYPDDYKDMIENLSSYMRSHGKMYDDHFATMMRWKHKDTEKKKGKAPPDDFWTEFEKIRGENNDET